MTHPRDGFRPLLLLGQPAMGPREKLPNSFGHPAQLRRPSPSEQHARLGAKWSTLLQTLETQSASIAAELQGTDPELVLVLEIVGDVPDFYRAVSRIAGFEFLAEVDESDVDGGETFADLANPTAQFDGTLFLMASNQVALAELLELWQLYRRGRTLPRGLTKWRDVFQLLLDVRRWSTTDRLRGTGVVEDFRERVEAGDQVVPAEIELWFRADPTARLAAHAKVSQLVEASGGRVVTSSLIVDIAYHALLVELPIQTIEPILRNSADDVRLIRADEIAFMRPEAQSAVALTAIDSPPDAPSIVRPPANQTKKPLVAVLDGLPLTRHQLLDGRLTVDDPDGWEQDILAAERLHGTATCSLVIHGDLNASDGPLSRPIYVRPVLRPTVGGFDRSERVPPDELALDLVHRCLVRMFENGTTDAAAPTIKLINLSIGDANIQLSTTLSPWARLLDFLAYKYNVLFIVSAGNHSNEIVFPYSPASMSAMDGDKLRSETLRLLVAEAERRRILSPSEAVNCLCVGALHTDACPQFVVGQRTDLLPTTASGGGSLPSPVSALGMGYKRSIKPDFVAPGGRILYRETPGGLYSPVTKFRPVQAVSLGPGLSTATPAEAGSLNGTRFFYGTSGAAAIASHFGGKILEQLEAFRDDAGNTIPDEYWPVLTKALLVHASMMPRSWEEVRDAFDNVPALKLREAVSRFYGYGALEAERSFGCTETRATAFGFGRLSQDAGARYDLPLPPSLSRNTIPRRLIITCASFTPVRMRSRQHRVAEVFVVPRVGALAVTRTGSDWRAVRRGTVQHEVFEGQRAAAYVDGDVLSVQVNCRAVGTPFSGTVPFGLAVTLEALDGSRVPVYSEVQERIQARVRARVR
ncbi:S8 family peptidase [Dactylosporangium sp. CA-052675]|uniref:S8 family peptidase n=1 Tax=Dactylosporangium sp. CA-052675 TaxID=3239927 RepID=UPI003D8EE54C